MAIRQNDDHTKKRVIGIFHYLDDLLKGIDAVKKANFVIEDVFSPTARREIQEVLGFKSSPVRYFTLVGGILGIIFGLGLGVYAHLQWKLVTGGKPILPWIPFVIIAFECCILLGVLSTVIGLSIKNRMPRFRLPAGYDPRFTEDRFGLLVSCTAFEEAEVSRLMKEAGADEIKEVPRMSKMSKMPKVPKVEID